MSGESRQGGYPGYDPVQAEFGDAALQPASPESLDAIVAAMHEVGALAHRHPVAELAGFDGPYLVHIKKHLEQGWADGNGEMIDYPTAEIFIYPDGVYSEKPETYTIWSGGEICKRDGDRFPFRMLEPAEADELAERLLEAIQEDAPQDYREGTLINTVLDATAARGARTYEIGDSLLIKGTGPDRNGLGPNNGEINFDIVEREEVLPELESFPRLTFSIKMETPNGEREYDEVAIHEDGVAHYEFRHYGEAGKPEPREKPETFEEKAARRQENEEWQEMARAAGLDLMTEEQARRVAGRLKTVLPRIKWYVAYPDKVDS